MKIFPNAISAADFWRYGLGRHRVALRLGMTLVAIGVAGPICRAAADGFAASVLIGGAFDMVAKLCEAWAMRFALSGVAAIFFATRLHPLADVRYIPTLAASPWRPGRPLPLGEYSLTGSFVLVPALVIATFAFVAGGKSSLSLALGATSGYAAFGVVTALLADSGALASMLVLVWLAAVPIARHALFEWLTPLLLAMLALSSSAQRAAVAHAFGRSAAPDIRRLNINRRSALGWFTHLPLKAKPRRWDLEFLASLIVGVAVVCVTFTVDAREGEMFRGLVLVLLLTLACVCFIRSLTTAPLSFGLVARVMTGRWFVPRMDRLLLAPALLFAWGMIVRLFPWPVFSPWNSLFGGVFSMGGMLIFFCFAPTRLAWQITGTTRIPLGPGQHQRQAEVMLKRSLDAMSIE